MTVQEAAKCLEVSPGLVYKLLKAGKLAHARIGLGRGVIRIDPASLEEFKRGCRVEVMGESEPTLRMVRGLVVPDMLSVIRRRKNLKRKAG
jgi:excisionase family DNA binding protein